jgi:hypothetical protein
MGWTGVRRRPWRLVVGVVVPLALAVAVGGTAAFLMRAHASGANAAASARTACPRTACPAVW